MRPWGHIEALGAYLSGSTGGGGPTAVDVAVYRAPEGVCPRRRSMATATGLNRVVLGDEPWSYGFCHRVAPSARFR